MDLAAGGRGGDVFEDPCVFYYTGFICGFSVIAEGRYSVRCTPRGLFTRSIKIEGVRLEAVFFFFF